MKNYTGSGLIIVLIALGVVAVLGVVAMTQLDYFNGEGFSGAVDTVGESADQRSIGDDINQEQKQDVEGGVNNKDGSINKTFASVRAEKRKSDVSAILNAVIQYTYEYGNNLDSLAAQTTYGDGTCGSDSPMGPYIGSIPLCQDNRVMIGIDISNEDISGDGEYDCQEYIDLGSNIGDGNISKSPILVEEYIYQIPTDVEDSFNLPDGGISTGYTICRSEEGRVTIAAPDSYEVRR